MNSLWLHFGELAFVTLFKNRCIFSGKMASSLLIVVIILGIILVPTVTSSLVHFEQGHQYEYEYTANITLDKVDTMRLAAKVILSFYFI